MGFNEAIAIRWCEMPEHETEGNAVKTNQRNVWFPKQSQHKDRCTLSVTREMVQKDGRNKGVRCTVILCSAFDETMCALLKTGKVKKVSLYRLASFT